jgi:hypothetical protein
MRSREEFEKFWGDTVARNGMRPTTTEIYDFLCGPEVKSKSVEKHITDEEIERLCDEWLYVDQVRFQCSRRELFKAGYRAAQSRNSIEWPSNKEVLTKINEISMPILRDMVSRRTFQIGITEFHEWLRSRLKGEKE